MLALAGGVAIGIRKRKPLFRSAPVTILSIPQGYVRDVSGSNSSRRDALTKKFSLVPSHPEVHEAEFAESLAQMVETSHLDPLAIFYASMHTVSVLHIIEDLERRAAEFVDLPDSDKEELKLEELSDANFLYLKSFISLLVKHGFIALNDDLEVPFEVIQGE